MALPAGRRKAANVTLLTSLVEGKRKLFDSKIPTLGATLQLRFSSYLRNDHSQGPFF